MHYQHSYPDLIREGAEHGLIDDPKKWLEYRRYINLTSHTYDKQKAQEVYLVAPELLPSAKSLLEKLRVKN